MATVECINCKREFLPHRHGRNPQGARAAGSGEPLPASAGGRLAAAAALLGVGRAAAPHLPGDPRVPLILGSPDALPLFTFCKISCVFECFKSTLVLPQLWLSSPVDLPQQTFFILAIAAQVPPAGVRKVVLATNIAGNGAGCCSLKLPAMLVCFAPS